MVVIGVDAHKRSHTAVAVDGSRKLAERMVAVSRAGHLELVRWARRWRDRTRALEDCRHLTRRLEADLLGLGERVVRLVNLYPLQRAWDSSVRRWPVPLRGRTTRA